MRWFVVSCLVTAMAACGRPPAAAGPESESDAAGAGATTSTTSPDEADDEAGGPTDEGEEGPGVLDISVDPCAYDEEPFAYIHTGSYAEAPCGEVVFFEGRIVAYEVDTAVIDACPCDADCAEEDLQRLELDDDYGAWPDTEAQFEVGSCVRVTTRGGNPVCGADWFLRVDIEDDGPCKLGLLAYSDIGVDYGATVLHEDETVSVHRQDSLSCPWADDEGERRIGDAVFDFYGESFELFEGDGLSLDCPGTDPRANALDYRVAVHLMHELVSLQGGSHAYQVRIAIDDTPIPID